MEPQTFRVEWGRIVLRLPAACQRPAEPGVFEFGVRRSFEGVL